MEHICRISAAAVINQLSALFDMHMVERLTVRLYPVEFGKELVRFGHTSDPLHQFSAHFAKWIDSEFAGQIRQTRKVTSENLGGREPQNQEWEKIVPQVA